MSADLDAFDRGLVDIGVTAAEALARVEAVEVRVAEIFRLMQAQTEAWDTWRQVTGPRASRPPQPAPVRHLRAVKP